MHIPLANDKHFLYKLVLSLNKVYLFRFCLNSSIRMGEKIVNEVYVVVQRLR